jgi:hypothetical protein
VIKIQAWPCGHDHGSWLFSDSVRSVKCPVDGRTYSLDGDSSGNLHLGSDFAEFKARTDVQIARQLEIALVALDYLSLDCREKDAFKMRQKAVDALQAIKAIAAE